MEKFISCNKCKDGYIHKNGEIIKCQCLKEYQFKNYLAIEIQKSGLPISILDYDINTYIGEDKDDNLKNIKQYVNIFEKKSNISLYFCGDSSTQKTTIAQWIGRELLKKSKTVFFINMGDLVDKLQKADRDEDILIFINELLEKDLLIIDDAVDSRKITMFQSGWQNAYIDKFFRKRLESLEKACIFTSNINYNNTWDTKFSEFIKTLIKRNTIFMEFKDSIEQAKKFDIDSLWD